jgi:hypothetical protein
MAGVGLLMPPVGGWLSAGLTGGVATVFLGVLTTQNKAQSKLGEFLCHQHIKSHQE